MRPPFLSILLPPERATASSAAVKIPPPPSPAPIINDDDGFDIPVDSELFSYPPLPSVDSTPQDTQAAQETQDTQGKETDDGFVPAEEVTGGPPAKKPRRAAARPW